MFLKNIIFYIPKIVICFISFSLESLAFLCRTSFQSRTSLEKLILIEFQMIELDLIQIFLWYHWKHQQQLGVNFVVEVLVVELHLVAHVLEDHVAGVADYLGVSYSFTGDLLLLWLHGKMEVLSVIKLVQVVKLGSIVVAIAAFFSFLEDFFDLGDRIVIKAFEAQSSELLLIFQELLAIVVFQ